MAFIIQLKRRNGGNTETHVDMWLASQIPTRWGSREQAMRFKTDSDAWRAAGILRVRGVWSVEEAEPL